MLSGKTRHELTCSGCGAPLHDLKMLPVGKAEAQDPAPRRKPKPRTGDIRPERPVKRKKVKRRKGLMARVLDEAMDLVEDIFD